MQIQKNSSYHSIMSFMQNSKNINQWNERRKIVKNTCKLAGKHFVTRFIDQGNVFSFQDKDNTKQIAIKTTSFATKNK